MALLKQTSMLERQHGEKLRAASRQQSTGNLGPQSNNPQGMESCQQCELRSGSFLSQVFRGALAGVAQWLSAIL